MVAITMSGKYYIPGVVRPDNEKVNRRVRALRLWNTGCQELVGVDRDGNEYVRETAFGAVAFQAGLKLALLAYETDPEIGERQKVADFLRDWADALIASVEQDEVNNS